MFYRLERSQKLNISLEKAWEFFSSPKNLKQITPEYMGFDITLKTEEKMYPGQIITYIVKPVMGIPLKWMTEITHVKDKVYFVDEQRFGPYSLWHHKHFFKEISEGIEMIDIVDYKIPFGWLGSIAHYFFIRKKLEEIFNYRYTKLNKLFNESI
jgi:ligand-binding SRPBCC domain-containing protein